MAHAPECRLMDHVFTGCVIRPLVGLWADLKWSSGNQFNRRLTAEIRPHGSSSQELQTSRSSRPLSQPRGSACVYLPSLLDHATCS